MPSFKFTPLFLICLFVYAFFVQNINAQQVLNGNFENNTLPNGYDRFYLGNSRAFVCTDSSIKVPYIHTYSNCPYNSGNWNYLYGGQLKENNFASIDPIANHPDNNNSNFIIPYLKRNYENITYGPTKPILYDSVINSIFYLKLSKPLTIGKKYNLTYYKADTLWTPYYDDLFTSLILRIGISSNRTSLGDSIGFTPIATKRATWQKFTITFIASNNANYLTLTESKKTNFVKLPLSTNDPLGDTLLAFIFRANTVLDNIYLEECPLTLGKDTTLCQGNSLRLQSIAPYSQYQWSTGDTTSNITINQTGKYWLNINNNGCQNTDTIVATFLPKKYAFLGKDTSLCVGNTITLNSPILGSYLWSNNAKTQSITINNAGIYSLTVNDSVCTHKDTINIQYENKQLLDIPNNYSLCKDSILTLNTQIINAKWHTANGTIISNLQTLNYKVPYSQIIFISSSLKCPYTDSIYITTQNCNAIEKLFFIPNAITPNDDGTNETYNPQATGWERKQMQIYNRWGELVYSTTQPQEGWNGSYKNAIVQDGIYIVKLTFKATDNSTGANPYYYWSGTVQVLR